MGRSERRIKRLEHEEARLRKENKKLKEQVSEYGMMKKSLEAKTASAETARREYESLIENAREIRDRYAELEREAAKQWNMKRTPFWKVLVGRG